MKENRIKLSIGVVSFVTMFIILCLVTFAILSLVSAKRNQEAGTRLVNKIELYYQMQNEAQEIVQELDMFLQDTYSKTLSKEEYFTSVKQRYVLDEQKQYHFAIEKDQFILNASITIQYPNAQEPFYIITNWNSQAGEPWQVEYSTDLLSKEE